AFLAGDAERRGVVVNAALASELPPILADRIQLQQAVVNLCVNALDAMAHTAPEKRRLSVRTSSSTGRSVEIDVSDTGRRPPPPPFRLVLLDQAGRHGARAVDLALDRGGPWGKDVGGESRRRRAVPHRASRVHRGRGGVGTDAVARTGIRAAGASHVINAEEVV